MVYDIVVSLLLFFSGIFFLVIIFIIKERKIIAERKKLISNSSNKLDIIKDKWLWAIDKTDLKTDSFVTLKNFLNASFIIEGESKRYKAICNELKSRGYDVIMLELKPGVKFPLIHHPII